MADLSYQQRSSWGSGPWEDEPDYAEWVHAELLCFMLRNSMGNWCGYVGVGREHPWYGKGYGDCTLPTAAPRGHRPEDDERPLGLPSLPDRLRERMEERLICNEDEYYCSHAPESQLEAHGGITFGDEADCLMLKKHATEEFAAALPGLWAFGFDCGHAWDISPGMRALDRQMGWDDRAGREQDVYRDYGYVKREVERLAEQLAAIESKVEMPR